MKRIEGLMAKELGEFRVLVIKGLNVAGAFCTAGICKLVIIRQQFEQCGIEVLEQKTL